jgi:CheY-like chemotaxis protein
MGPQPGEQPDRAEVVNRAEEILFRARQTIRRMSRRIWKAVESQPLPGPHSGAGPGVLLAEDEPVIRGLLGMLLRGQGFVVWPAADGHEALDVYGRHRDDIRVVLLDVHMPRLDGPQTLRALRALDPAVACCFITGTAGGTEEEQLRALGATAVLHKPCTPEELADALHQAMGAAAPDGTAQSEEGLP